MKHVTPLLLALMVIPTAGLAHEGPTLNDDGCHQDERYNKYHCHDGVLEGREFDNPQQAANALITEAIRPKNQSSEGQPEVEDRDPS